MAEKIDSKALQGILISLPRVLHLQLESWTFASGEQESYDCRELARRLPTLPNHLKKINLFWHRDTPLPEHAKLKPPCRRLGSHLALRSYELEELSACNVIDARHFFIRYLEPGQPRAPYPRWEALRLLTPTSGAISEAEGSMGINAFLQGVERAAQHMPVLRIMELYNADEDGGGLFRYQWATAMNAEVSWVSTWRFRMDKNTKEIWSSAARQMSYRLEAVFLSEEVVTKYEGPAMFVNTRLLTRDFALHPTSVEDLQGGRRRF